MASPEILPDIVRNQDLQPHNTLATPARADAFCAVNTDAEQMTGRVGDYITIEEIMS